MTSLPTGCEPWSAGLIGKGTVFGVITLLAGQHDLAELVCHLSTQRQDDALSLADVSAERPR